MQKYLSPQGAPRLRCALFSHRPDHLAESSVPFLEWPGQILVDASMPLSSVEFQSLALEQLDALDRFARSLSKGRDSDDLVQETLLRALKSQHTFDLRSHGIRPWLFRICYNVFLSRGKRDSSQPRALEQEMLQSIPAPSNVQWESSINFDELEEAISQLTPDLRSTLTLWAVDELSYREIAEVMNVPIGTVMSRLFRARAKLADLLKQVGITSARSNRDTEADLTQSSKE